MPAEQIISSTSTEKMFESRLSAGATEKLLDFSKIGASCLVQEMCVVYLCLSSSSDDHPSMHSCLGTGTRVETRKQVLSLSVFVGPSGIIDRIGLCWRLGGSSITILPISNIDYSDHLQTVASIVRCVLVNTLQYLDTFDFVSDLETEDPHVKTNIAARSYDMEGHAKKCLGRYCELAKKHIEQLYEVSTPCLDDHQFKKEELESVGELSNACSKLS